MRVVIIGASHAGNTAAIHLMKRDPSIEVILLEKYPFHSFIASGINLLMKHVVGSLADASLYEKGDLLNLGIDLRENCEVTDIIAEKNTVFYYNHELKKEEKLTYDNLILATGSTQNHLSFDYMDDDRFISYKTFQESKDKLPTLTDAKKVVVMGAGFIGLELADWLGKEKEVYLIEQMDHPLLHYFDEEFLNPVMRKLKQNIQFKFNNSVTQVTEGKNNLLNVTLMTGEVIPEVDCVVSAINGSPNSEFLQGIVETAFDGAVMVNEFLQTSVPNIYAIGDLIEQHFFNKKLENNRMFLPLVANALRSAVTAGENILTNNTISYGHSNRTIVTKISDFYLGSTGINRMDALGHQLPTRTIEKVFSSHDLSEEPNHPIFTKLQLTISTTGSKEKVIGGQILTTSRTLIENINLLSIIVKNEYTLWDIVELDFYFQPEFKPYVNIIKDLVLEDIYSRPLGN